jgi:pyruvate dehydrogenase E2 component (dihydrolipoamide acetyltransferase)
VSTEVIKIPDIGGAEAAEVIEVCVAVGDTIAQEDSLVVLETDKASMEVPSPLAGQVTAISMKVGDQVAEGDVILELTLEAATPEASAAPVEPAPEPVVEQSVQAPAAASNAITVPDLGGADNVDVIEVCVAVGDEVAEGDSLLVLETDKASMEVPAPQAGKLIALHVAEGDKVSVGDLIAELAGAAAVMAAPVASDVSESVAQVASAVSDVMAVKAPDLGGAEHVDVIEVCVSAGDQVSEGDSLIVLETDKASMEIPAPAAGRVKSIAVAEGGKINVGDLIVELEVQGAAVESAKSPVPEQAAAPAEKPSAGAGEIHQPSIAKAAVPVSETKSASKIYAGPAVRKLCREFGVDLEQVAGTGPKGRVLKEDVQAFVKESLSRKPQAVTSGTGIPPIPEIDFSQFGEVDVQTMSKLHKLTAMNMQRAWLNVPHVTQFDEADITDLEEFRKGLKAEAEKRGVKVTPLPFLLKACAAALKAHPQFNASLHADGEHIVYKNYVHIGIAVDTPAGLVVPVVRDVDQKSVWELSAEIAELGAKAKDRKLKPVEMQGGCFTISSLGNIGGQGFTPIVNAPEVAILGVSRLAVKPVWDGKEFVPRKMLPLALSYDHRAVNGADAGRFFTFLGELLGDIRRLTL